MADRQSDKREADVTFKSCCYPLAWNKAFVMVVVRLFVHHFARLLRQDLCHYYQMNHFYISHHDVSY